MQASNCTQRCHDAADKHMRHRASPLCHYRASPALHAQRQQAIRGQTARPALSTGAHLSQDNAVVWLRNVHVIQSGKSLILGILLVQALEGEQADKHSYVAVSKTASQSHARQQGNPRVHTVLSPLQGLRHLPTHSLASEM